MDITQNIVRNNTGDAPCRAERWKEEMRDREAWMQTKLVSEKIKW